MAPRNRSHRFAPRCGALLACTMLLGIATSASPAPAKVTADPLEPAKAAIRVKDYTRAIGVLTDLSGRGHAGGQYLLGTMHLAGLGTAQDPAQARQLFETAANAGDARAAYALAALLATGETPDRPAARRWLARAAELGDPDAQALVRRQALPLEFRPHDLLTDESARRSALWRAAARDDVATTRNVAGRGPRERGGRLRTHRAAPCSRRWRRGRHGCPAGTRSQHRSSRSLRCHALDAGLRLRAARGLYRAAAGPRERYRGRSSRQHRAGLRAATLANAAGAGPARGRRSTRALQRRSRGSSGRRSQRTGSDGCLPGMAGHHRCGESQELDDAGRSVASGRRSERDDAGRRNGTAGRRRRGCGAIGCIAAAGRRGCLPSEPQWRVTVDRRSAAGPRGRAGGTACERRRSQCALEAGAACAARRSRDRQCPGRPAVAGGRGRGRCPGCRKRPAVDRSRRAQPGFDRRSADRRRCDAVTRGRRGSIRTLGRLVQRRLCGRRLAAESRCHRRRGRSRRRDTARLRCGARSCGRRRSPRALRCESRGPHGQR